MRKTRFEVLYQEYESEIKALEQRFEESQTENHHIKEINKDLKTRLESAEMRLSQAIKAGQQEKANGEAVTQDINTILKLSSRLQDMINYNKTLKEENDTFKVDLRDAKRQNDALKDEVNKLVDANKYPKSPQRFSRYAVAALQTKADNYEREVVRLRRALERSDEYVDELKQGLDSQYQPHDASNHQVRNNSDFSGSDDRLDIEPSNRVVENAAQSSSHPNSDRQTSRIDEFANIALATRHLPVDASSLDNPSDTQQRSPLEMQPMDPVEVDDIDALSQLASKYTATGVDVTASGGDVIDDQRVRRRSIFEDSSKFPACAKLIELTKFRRDVSDPSPTDAGSAEMRSNDISRENAVLQSAMLDKNSLLNMLMQPREGISSPISTTMVGREGSAFSVVTNNQSRRLPDAPLCNTSPQRSTQTDNNNQADLSPHDSPPTLLKMNFAGCSREETDDGNTSEKSSVYPSTVVLNCPVSAGNYTPDDFGVLAKRIKIEQGN